MIEFVHGDARKLAWDVADQIDCIITDPPYGVDQQSNFARTTQGKQYTRKIEADADLATASELWFEVMPPLVAHLADDADLYVFTSWKVLDTWRANVEALDGLRVENVLVWEKGWPGLGDLEHNWAFSWEAIIYAKKGNRKIRNRRCSVLAFDRPATSKLIHPTEKPVELICELIHQSTDPGALVVDPFAGSGSTLRACQKTGRRAIGFEIDDRYYRDAKSRLDQPALLLM